MKRNGGFSLIELLVVLGIIGILSSLITPKVMGYMAKGKETKAAAVLESLRTASELYFFEEGKSFTGEDGYKEITVEQLKKLEPYLSNNVNSLIGDKADSDEVKIEIGGSRETASGTITYGGEIGFTTADINSSSNNSKADGVKIWFKPSENIGEYNINGDKWTDL